MVLQMYRRLHRGLRWSLAIFAGQVIPADAQQVETRSMADPIGTFSGIASGIQWRDMVDQIMQIESQRRLTPLTDRQTVLKFWDCDTVKVSRKSNPDGEPVMANSLVNKVGLVEVKGAP